MCWWYNVVGDKMVSKGSKRRLMLLGTMSLVAIIYFGYVLVSYTTNIIKLSNEEKQLETHLLNLREEEDNLKTEIIKLNDPDYVARYARENFLYSRDGEYIIRIDNLDNNDDSDEILEHGFPVMLGFIFFLIILILLIFRNKMKKANN